MQNRKNLEQKLSPNVRKKIAFEIFSTKDTHQEIANKFNISRSLVSKIAQEFNLQRVKRAKGHRRFYHKSFYNKSDILSVNIKYDDECIKKRLREYEHKLIITLKNAMNIF